MICFNDRPRASRPFFLFFLALALALLTAYVVSPGIVLGLVILAALVSAGIIAAIEKDWGSLVIIIMDIAIAVYLVFFALAPQALTLL